MEGRTVLQRAGAESPPAPDRRGDCVVCGLSLATRGPQRYFTDWDNACGVQTANLLYEMGLILWAIVREIPSWCDANTVRNLDRLRRALRTASIAMMIQECPICHRPTTHLYGSPPRFCRWCLDMSGGFGVGIALTSDGTIQVIQPDPAAATFEDADLLPPLR